MPFSRLSAQLASLSGLSARLAAAWPAQPPAPPPADAVPPAFARPAARGVADRHNPGVRCIVVRVDAPTFERLAAAAGASGVSVTEAIRQLIRRGLDAAPHANGKG